MKIKFLVCQVTFLLNSVLEDLFMYQGRSHCGGHWDHTPTLQFLRQEKVQQFQFQTSKILLLTGAQKLYGPEIPQFLTRMLQSAASHYF